MNKTEVNDLIKKELDNIFSDQLKKYLKKPEVAKIIKDYNKEALSNFVRALWTQRSFWDNKI